MNQPSTPDASAIRKSRAKMLTVIGMFFVPFFIAIFGYFFFPQFFASGTRVNNAPLIEPLVTLEEFTNLQPDENQFTIESLQKYWTIVHRLDGPCDEECQVSLYNTRQTRLALGKDAGRIQRVLLGSDISQLEEIAREHPDAKTVLRIIGGIDNQLQPIIQRESLGINDAMMIDPLGNVMMAIPAALDPTKLLKDLKKLLRLSKVG